MRSSTDISDNEYSTDMQIVRRINRFKASMKRDFGCELYIRRKHDLQPASDWIVDRVTSFIHQCSYITSGVRLYTVPLLGLYESLGGKQYRDMPEFFECTYNDMAARCCVYHIRLLLYSGRKNSFLFQHCIQLQIAAEVKRKENFGATQTGAYQQTKLYSNFVFIIGKIYKMHYTYILIWVNEQLHNRLPIEMIQYISDFI